MHVNNFLSICPPFFQLSIFLPLLTTNTCKIERKKANKRIHFKSPLYLSACCVHKK